jgi:hypothetical protein
MTDFLLIILPILTIVVFVWYFGWLRRSRKPKKAKVDDRTRQERAIWAWAKILSSNQAPVSTYHVARVDLQLEVHMPGNPAYQVKTTWLVDEDSLAYVQQGQEISLKVDPLGPEHVYPNGSWAQLLTMK